MSENKIFIDELKKDLITLGNVIKRSDRLIMSLKSEELKNYYRKELLYMVNQYYELEQLLKQVVDNYTEWEKENNTPIDFSIRKLQKSLNSD